jgi:hypothetical protein
MLMGIDRSRPPSLGGDHGRWDKRRRVEVLLAVFTQLTVRLLGQAGKGLRGFGASPGLLSQQALWHVASLPRPI